MEEGSFSGLGDIVVESGDVMTISGELALQNDCMVECDPVINLYLWSLPMPMIKEACH